MPLGVIPMEPCCPYAPDESDLPGLIRHMKGAHPEMTEATQAHLDTLAESFRSRWQYTFPGGLKIIFVCQAENKRKLLQEVMAVSDLVPLVFGAGSATETPAHFEVVLEI